MQTFKVSIYIIIVTLSLNNCGSHKVYTQSIMVSKPYPAPSLDRNTQEKYLQAINKVRSTRRSCGKEGSFPAVPALRWNDALYRAAYEHSNDMLQSKIFSHKGSGRQSDWTARVQNYHKGSNFKARIENNGYKQWKNIAENIEAGASTLEQVMQHWLNADAHCANIMNPDFTDVGMAHTYKKDSKWVHYWTQNFAAHQ